MAPLSPVNAQAATNIQVVESSSFSTLIVDDTLTPGSSFTVDVYATDLPPIVNSTNGGVNGFDITIRYDVTVLTATDASHTAPLCPAAEGCLFDSPMAITLERSINNTVGFAKVAVVLLGGQVSGSGTLFRIMFEVAGVGFATIDLDEQNSAIVGPIGPTTVVEVPYKSEDGEFENRQPFQLSAFPPSGFTVPGQSFSTNITATQVWTVQAFDENISFGNGPVPLGTSVTYSPQEGKLPFTTRLTFQTSTTTPPGSYKVTIVGTSSVTNERVELNYTLGIGTVNIGIVSVVADRQVVNPGQNVDASITLVNEGDTTESFQIDLYAQTQSPSTPIVIGPVQVTGLGPLETRGATVSWNTSGFAPGSYVIQASIEALTGEVLLSDNVGTSGVIRVNAPPSAVFTVSPEAQISFDASQSADHDGAIASYSWDFGDGQTGTGSRVTHSYVSPGSYTVILTVRDNDGGVSTISGMVILDGPTTVSPVPLLLTAGIVLVLILLAAVFLLRRGRKKPKASAA